MCLAHVTKSPPTGPNPSQAGHSEPFIAEGGSCVYLAEDYFHLKPAHTIRLGRFIAIPVAKPQPAAAEALELLSEQTGITVVPLRSLSPRELIQNTGLLRERGGLHPPARFR